MASDFPHPPLILMNMVVAVINDREHDVQISQYSQRVVEAGGVPMLMPSIENEEMFSALLDVADGCVLIGGPDYDPALYGEKPHPETGLSRLRPTCDIAFCRALLKRDLPVLGICAGCQLLNIVAGGKLVQHVENHRKTTHPAKVTAEGFFARALGRHPGDEIVVNSFHHQVVDPGHLGAGMVVSGEAHDGTVEAIEMPGERLVLGVQFHPERMDDLGPRFFGQLVEEAERYRRGRKSVKG